MPKLGGMAQLSRPFQIALIALGVFVLAWFAVLHRPGGSSTSSSPPSVSSPASSSAHSSGSASGAPKSSSVHQGSVSGLEGLTRDVHRAHGAAAEVESNGREVQSKAVQGTGEAASGGTPAAASHSTAGAHTGTGAGSSAGTSASASAAAGSRVQRHTHTSSGATRTASGAATTATAALTLHHLTEALHLNVVVDLVEAIDPGLGLKAKVAHAEDTLVARMKTDLQPTPPATIAAELHQGKTVLLLFLNPHSYDDDATAIDTTEVAHKLRHHVAAHLALAGQVNSFGSITRNIQVYQTPTLLIINPKLQVTTLTGLTDGFSIEQAVAEARK
jgi:hypothetical protein